MDDHVGDLGTLLPDPLLDLAGTTVRVGERRPWIQPEGHKGDETVVGFQEPKLTWRRSRRLTDDLLDEARVALDRRASRRLGERLEVSLDGDDLRQRLRDRTLDFACDGVGVFEGQI